MVQNYSYNLLEYIALGNKDIRGPYEELPDLYKVHRITKSGRFDRLIM
jgi:hypothetical protein